MNQKRSIFEEVGDGAAARPAPPTTGVIDKAAHRGARGAIRVWLMILFALVVLMIAVGGLTRLTDSGLSITEWRPVTGAMPPLTAEAWEAEFEAYKQIDEYQLQNSGMTMAEFKVIYWWEWGHRQLGRVIGLVWALGFVWFAATRRFPSGSAGLAVPLIGFGGFAGIIGVEYARRSGALDLALSHQIEAGLLIAMGGIAALGLLTQARMDWTARALFVGFLGGLQGAIGWWMVSSGVTEGEGMLDVASYRLATHLGLAFIILGLLAWYVFKLGRSEADLLQARRSRDAKLFSMGTGLTHFAFLQILLGALVAGIDAGRSFNDWPLMGGYWLPPEPLSLTPIWRNFFEDAGLVQFMHRVAGYLLFVFGIVVWLRARKSANTATRMAFNAVMAMMLLQMVLGIATVLYLAPWHLAILHQFGAVLLFTLILRARFLAQFPRAQSVRGTA